MPTAMARFLDNIMPGSDSGHYLTDKIVLTWQLGGGSTFLLVVNRGPEKEIISGLESLGWKNTGQENGGYILVKSPEA